MSIEILIHNYGLWVVFGVVMFESMGVPLPGETALIAAALFAGTTHQLDILIVVIVAALGAMAGDNIGYVLGRTIGLRLLKRYGGYIRLDVARLEIGEYLFMRHGGKIVFFGRFVAFLRAFAAVLAGANHMHWRRFVVMNALGALCWASLVGGGAYLFGERIKRVSGPVSIAMLAIALGVIVTGIFFFRRHETELHVKAHAALAERWKHGGDMP